jgi:hypothetical protein
VKSYHNIGAEESKRAKRLCVVQSHLAVRQQYEAGDLAESGKVKHMEKAGRRRKRQGINHGKCYRTEQEVRRRENALSIQDAKISILCDVFS